MRAIILVAAICLLGCSTYVAATGFAMCVFQGSSTVHGSFRLQQLEPGSDTTIIANFTSTASFTKLWFHIHTYGDLDLAESEQTCWTDVTMGPYSAIEAPHYVLQTSWVAGINMFGSNSIIGRRGALYAGHSVCANSVDNTPIASCVFGVRNVLATAENLAGQYLESNPVSGYAKLVGTTGQYGDNEAITGRAWFVPTSTGDMYVNLLVTGLAAYTRHAFHVHAWGDISGGDALSAGLHLNPYGLVHGYPPNPIRHMGDMGNVTSDALGVAHLEATFDIMSMIATAGNIVGRAIIIHSLGDDGNPTGSVTSTGAAGGRLAKAIIGISPRLPEGYSESAMKARLAARASLSAIATPNTPQAEALDDTPALAPAAPAIAEMAPALAPPSAMSSTMPATTVVPTTATVTTTTTSSSKARKSAKKTVLIAESN